MMTNRFFEKIVERINSDSEKYKNVFPIILILPTFIGGLWQILELIFIDPSLIRFFSITQLIADGILILSITIILALYLHLLDKHFDFKNLVKFDLLNTQFNPYQLLAGLVLIICTSSYYYIGFNDVGLDYIENSRIGALLIQLLLAGIFLPLFLKGILVFSREILIISFFKNQELKVKRLKEFKNKKGALYYLVHFISLILMSTTLMLFIISIIVLVEFRNKTIYPQNLENLKNIFKQIHDEFGKNQKASILYFNDTYIFVELENNRTEEKTPKRIKIYKTDDVLFK
ncbi:hypothetical protein [Chryseobacterium caseinilyticum]|uniref:Glycerophosphoryl diester phosphodiesterase membrane domain-containing protein n=1 Tax=Chryseobacterium caseinilyticum TaxID=2771428 RepID=A0ABR8Z8Y8_9FLAO|nr:hypothetical protein [Chryseobacterium caseinilyticum]MBD8081727.1 hypothetical protein [Chryseobacterium caseinilyticum]